MAESFKVLLRKSSTPGLSNIFRGLITAARHRASQSIGQAATRVFVMLAVRAAGSETSVHDLEARDGQQTSKTVKFGNISGRGMEKDVSKRRHIHLLEKRNIREISAMSVKLHVREDIWAIR